MSDPSHHFLPGLTNVQPVNTRSQFSTGPMQNGMQNQLGNQIPGPLPSPMNSQLNNQMVVSQMNNHIGSPNNQMLGPLNQQYNMGNNNPLTQEVPNSIQMQQNPMASLQPNMQQQGIQHTANVTPTPAATQSQQSKEFNTASLCRIGQETVQDIVSRTQEVFQTLKVIQPSNGTSLGTGSSNEKKAKVQELLRTIRVLFKRLRLIYEKCNENCQLQGMEYTHIESLIPFKDEMDPKYDEKKNAEGYRLICDDSKEIIEQVIMKNKQLKEVIDHLRRIIWEINTMLTMRKS